MYKNKNKKYYFVQVNQIYSSLLSHINRQTFLVEKQQVSLVEGKKKENTSTIMFYVMRETFVEMMSV